MRSNLSLCHIVLGDGQFIFISARIHVGNLKEWNARGAALLGIWKANAGSCFTYLPQLTLFPSKSRSRGKSLGSCFRNTITL